MLLSPNTNATIIDNNSTDKTVELIENLKKEYFWVKTHYLDENIGFGSANNIAFKTNPSDYYVLLNADAWLLTDSVSPIISIISLGLMNIA